MKKKIDLYTKENPEGFNVPYYSYEYELTDEKCKDCKHADTNDTHCVNCTHRLEPGTLRFDLTVDCFEPKEEQSTIEHDGCKECVYEDFEEFEEPCVNCKGTYKHNTMAYLKAKDCYVHKDESSNCVISCKECNKDFTNEDYGFEEISNDEIDMVNHPQHYSARGIDPIDYIESHNFNFNLGNVIKYVSRDTYKGIELQDLEKAQFYLEREIKKHESNY